MTMKPCDRELARKIYLSSENIRKDGEQIILKAVPDQDRKGILDPREYEIRKAIYEFRRFFPPTLDLETIRTNTRTYTIPMISTEVKESELELSSGGKTFRVYVYEPESVKEKKTKERVPAFVWIHGGSYISSAAQYYKDPFMYLAEQAQCPVFNIDYSLAPESKYPAAVNEILTLLAHIHDHAQEYGADPSKIAISGDSAGGNLAIAAVLDADPKIRPSYMALFYPCVDLCAEDGLYEWEESAYNIEEEQRELILSRLTLGRSDGKGNNELMYYIFREYLGERINELKRKADVSPVYADLSCLPRTDLFLAEFDALRIQAEYFAGLLSKANVEHRTFRYEGVTHAFLDYFGILPQAQAAIMEIADVLKDMK